MWRLSFFLFCSSHLADLKSLTHDVLYETYRTEKLSRTVHSDTQCVLSFLVPLLFLTPVSAGTRPFFRSSLRARVFVSRKKSSAGRKRRSVVCCSSTLDSTLTIWCPSIAARDRASRSARDQREEAGAVGEGGIAQVSTSLSICGGWKG